MTDLHLHASDDPSGLGALEYVGAPAGPAGLAVLEIGALRVVADGARPSRLVEIVIDDALDASAELADDARRLGITRDGDGDGDGIHINGARAALLGRLALAIDERNRGDSVSATDWSVDIVVIADALGLNELAAREADVAAAVLFAARARLTAAAVDAAHVVGRYTSASTTAALSDLVAVDDDSTTFGSQSTSTSVSTHTRAPALAVRDGEHRQRVAGAVALHPHQLPDGVAVSRRGRLVWQPGDGRLRIELDVVGPGRELWVRISDADGVIGALAPLAGQPTMGAPDAVQHWTGVAELIVGGHNDLTTMVVEVTGDATLPLASIRARATAEAIADGRDGASAARNRRWARARDAWLRSARAWSRADDTDRQALALIEAAAAFEQLGDGSEATTTRERAAATPTTWADVDGWRQLDADPSFVADGLSA